MSWAVGGAGAVAVDGGGAVTGVDDQVCGGCGEVDGERSVGVGGLLGLPGGGVDPEPGGEADDLVGGW